MYIEAIARRRWDGVGGIQCRSDCVAILRLLAGALESFLRTPTTTSVCLTDTFRLASQGTPRFVTVSTAKCWVFTARRNARIASAVLAMTIPSVRPSVRLSVTRRYFGRISFFAAILDFQNVEI